MPKARVTWELDNLSKRLSGKLHCDLGIERTWIEIEEALILESGHVKDATWWADVMLRNELSLLLLVNALREME